MESQIRGKVWKFGDDINTDIISPGEYMDASYEEIGKHAMERAYPGFSDAIEKGDIIVSGLVPAGRRPRLHCCMQGWEASLPRALPEYFSAIASMWDFPQ